MKTHRRFSRRNDKKLEFKFNRACLSNPHLAIQDYCEEHSFSLPLLDADLQKINELLLSLGLHQICVADLSELQRVNNFTVHYVVDKRRISYAAQHFTLGIDEVADLGTFLEVELMATSIENIDTIKKEMQHLLVGLSLRPLKTGYGTLLLRKKDFKHYLLGRFILEEDIKYRDRLSA